MLIAIQRFSTPFLDSFFQIVTQLGHYYVYILLLLFLYWCVDRRTAHRIAVLYLCSMWLNGYLKEVYATPRPSLQQGVRVLATEDSFSFPSGHSQGAMTFWTALAWSYGSKLLWLIAALVIVLVGFSRMYLGVHFLVDVVGGYLIGLALVVLWALAGQSGVIASLSRGVRLFFALVAPVALFPLYQSDASYQTLGFLLGFTVSDLFALELMPYDPRGGVFRQSAKMLIGLAGMAGLYYLHRYLPPGAPEALGYAVIAVWITIVAPWLFIRLGLARASEPPSRRGRFADSPALGSGVWLRGSSLYGRARWDRPLRSVFLATLVVGMGLAGLVLWYEPPAVPVAKPVASFPRERGVVIGHRGAAGLAPENTLIGIERGLAEGSDWIEIDVQLTADGHLVLMHDPTVERTTNGSGRVEEMTLAQIKTLDAGYRFTADGGSTYPYRGMGIEVPTLEEVLLAFPAARFVVEVKGDNVKAAEALADVLLRTGSVSRVIVGSFSDRVIVRFREVLPDVPTTAGKNEAAVFYLLSRFGLDAFASPQWEILAVPPRLFGWLPVINRGLVVAAERHERLVFAFTVNEEGQASRLVTLGVNGIVTDRPDVVVPVVRSL